MRKEVIYICQYCNKQFSDADECMEHEKTHKRDCSNASNEEVKKALQQIEDAVWGWHVGNMICGIPVTNFESIIGILSRGKRMDNGEWLYGFVFVDVDGSPAIPDFDVMEEDELKVSLISVNPETVGQYTELDDINGKKIFDGDILEAKLDDESERVTRVVVEWGEFGWQTHQPGCYPDDMTKDDIGIWKVVGNRWDNPELLEYADEGTAQYADMPVLMPAT